MKQQFILTFLVCVFVTTSAWCAEDISSILRQIKSEQVGAATKPKPSPVAAPKKKKQRSSGSSVAKSQEPRIPIWSPRDKLPKVVTGHYLAGDFAVRGEDISGCATIIPLQDAMNPFARQFNVVNMSTGLAPGTLIPIGRRPMVSVPRSRPLIFIGKGLLPGIYQVQAQ